MIGFVLFGFVYAYPQINEVINLPFSYSTIVFSGFILLVFVITPLYWRASTKQAKEEKDIKEKQPWEQSENNKNT